MNGHRDCVHGGDAIELDIGAFGVKLQVGCGENDHAHGHGYAHSHHGRDHSNSAQHLHS